VTLSIVDPNHSVLLNGELNYWEDPSYTDPCFITTFGAELNVLNHGSVSVSYSALSGPGALSGLDPTTLNVFVAWTW